MRSELHVTIFVKLRHCFMYVCSQRQRERPSATIRMQDSAHSRQVTSPNPEPDRRHSYPSRRVPTLLLTAPPTPHFQHPLSNVSDQSG